MCVPMCVCVCVQSIFILTCMLLTSCHKRLIIVIKVIKVLGVHVNACTHTYSIVLNVQK